MPFICGARAFPLHPFAYSFLCCIGGECAVGFQSVDDRAPHKFRARRKGLFRRSIDQFWKLARKQPSGYRSGVDMLLQSGGSFFAVGTNGMDGGRESWYPLAQGNFNAISLAPLDVGWAVGPEGMIVRFYTVPNEMRAH